MNKTVRRIILTVSLIAMTANVNSQKKEKTVEYLAGEFRASGLEPAFDGSFFQTVKVISTTVNVPGNVIPVKTCKGREKLRTSEDIMVWINENACRRLFEKAGVNYDEALESAKHPVFPMDKTATCINFDCIAPAPRTRDIPILGGLSIANAPEKPRKN